MRKLALLTTSLLLALPAWASTDLIRDLEQQLDLLGYDVGAIDGRYDENLRTAVEQFQGDQGMAVSGNLDPTTRERLNQVAAAKQGSTPAPAAPAASAPAAAQGSVAGQQAAAEQQPAAQAPTPQTHTGGIVFGKRFGGVVGGSIEFGGDDIGTVFFTDGSSQDITAGDGVGGEIGIFGRPAPAPFALRATLGFKYATSQASNADINVNRLVFNLIGTHEVGQFRYGGGLTHHSNISYDADGLGPDGDFDDALGFTVELGWSWLVLSYTNIEYEAEGSRQDFDASNFGLRTLFAF